MKTLLTFFKHQATLMRRSTVLHLPAQLVFPGCGIAQGAKASLDVTAILAHVNAVLM